MNKRMSTVLTTLLALVFVMFSAGCQHDTEEPPGTASLGKLTWMM